MTRRLTDLDRIDALLSWPGLYSIGDLLDHRLPTRRHPASLHLAFGAMSRILRSSNRADQHVNDPQMWRRILDVHHDHGGRRVGPYLPPLTSDTYRHFRDAIIDRGLLDEFAVAFTDAALTTCDQIGLLHDTSRTHPDATATVYGDGTIVRPMATNGTRQDPDAFEHIRHDGHHHGNKVVHFAVRGPQPHRRVLLGVDLVTAPGAEAAAAVELLRRIVGQAGDRITAVVYDGAFRGVHHETIMTDLGLVPINRVHPASNGAHGRRYVTIALGEREHDVNGRPCKHTLVATGSNIYEQALNDTGEVDLAGPLRRVTVKRRPRAGGGWRFLASYRIPCVHGDLTVWTTPHTPRGDRTHRRPDQLRLIPEADPDFAGLYGLRNDAESINRHYKATLPDTRAACLGAQRQLLDFHCYGIATNAVAHQLHR